MPVFTNRTVKKSSLVNHPQRLDFRSDFWGQLKVRTFILNILCEWYSYLEIVILVRGFSDYCACCAGSYFSNSFVYANEKQYVKNANPIININTFIAETTYRRQTTATCKQSMQIEKIV